ncbi:MAG: ParB-like nuclease domain-containing protein [Clostridia bacterium]|nr:ParB-like nuclease domain-containing protein [Clostridia bacterium]
MKYQNAGELLPEALLREVQKYISGKLMYVPARQCRQQWGEVSGCRQMLIERNCEIRSHFAVGESVEQLADSYNLSCESIRRIVYNRKEGAKMEHHGTLSSAQEWARQGKLEDWVHAYLLSDGDNKPFSDGLKIVDRIFIGPIKMPLTFFKRCTGPVEEKLQYRVDPETWEKHVQQLMNAILQDADIPPLVVHFMIPYGQTTGIFELSDGNHRWEAYNRLGIEQAHVIVWITDEYEFEQFMERFGNYVK